MFAKQELYYLSYTSNPFCSVILEMGVSQTICPGWPGTLTLPMVLGFYLAILSPPSGDITGSLGWYGFCITQP
jgi:hypothetical protein